MNLIKGVLLDTSTYSCATEDSSSSPSFSLLPIRIFRAEHTICFAGLLCTIEVPRGTIPNIDTVVMKAPQHLISSE